MILNLTSFPRSGNSFFTTTLLAFGKHWQLSEGGAVEFQPVKLFTKEHEGYPTQQLQYLHPQQMDPNPVDRIKDPDNLYIYKRHDHPDDYVGDRIYLARDGRDVLVSYARHNLVHQGAMENRLNGINEHPTAIDKDAFLKELRRLVETAAWGEWVKRGVNHFNTMSIVRYEDMLQNPVETASKALADCGYEVEQVADQPTFKELNKLYPWFYNKGKAGDYRDWMPQDLVGLFNEINKDALEMLGYSL
jgi:hypothetical protein